MKGGERRERGQTDRKKGGERREREGEEGRERERADR